MPTGTWPQPRKGRKPDTSVSGVTMRVWLMQSAFSGTFPEHQLRGVRTGVLWEGAKGAPKSRPPSWHLCARLGDGPKEAEGPDPECRYCDAEDEERRQAQRSRVSLCMCVEQQCLLARQET